MVSPRKRPVLKILRGVSADQSIRIENFQERDFPALKEILLSNVPKYFAPHEVGEWMSYLSQHSDSYYMVRFGSGIVGAGGFFSPSKHVIRLSWDLFLLNITRRDLESLCYFSDWKRQSAALALILSKCGLLNMHLAFMKGLDL